MADHQLTAVAHDARGVVFLCGECGRRIAMDSRSHEITVLDRGDQWATHAGSTHSGLRMTVGVGQ